MGPYPDEPQTHEVECWLVLKAVPGTGCYQKGPYRGERRIDRVSASQIRQKKPNLADDEIAVKLKFDVHASQFLESATTITATLGERQPDDSVQAATVEETHVRGRSKSPATSVFNRFADHGRDNY